MKHRGPGRPKGSKNKRGPGRPPNSRDIRNARATPNTLVLCKAHAFDMICKAFKEIEVALPG